MSLIENVGVLCETNTKTFEWTIKNFSSYFETEGLIQSPDFRLSSYLWNLIIDPNPSDWKGFIALYFCENEKHHGPYSPYKTYVEFTFGLKTVYDEIVNEVTSEWTQNKEGWEGFEDFIEKSKLLENKDKLMPSDSLTVTCWTHIKDSMPDLVTRLFTLSVNFKDMFISQKNADLLIDVKGQRLSAHKFILAARCPALSTKIESEMSKKKTGIVNILDCDPEVFYMFLSYLYSGELNFAKCNVFSLYKIAVKYDMPELKSICIYFMIRSLSVKNVCEAYVLGHKFNEGKLLLNTQTFFEKNFNEIISSDSWISFLKEDCQLANNLLKTMAPKIVINNGFY